MDIFAETLGYIAGICTAVVFMPQAIKTIRTKDVAGLSLLSYIIYSIGMISWTLYGVYLHSLQMEIFNGISLISSLIILFLIIRERLKTKL